MKKKEKPLGPWPSSAGISYIYLPKRGLKKGEKTCAILKKSDFAQVDGRKNGRGKVGKFSLKERRENKIFFKPYGVSGAHGKLSS